MPPLTRLAIFVTVAATCAWGAPAAGAAFPGNNGLIAYSQDEDQCCEGNIHLIQPDGSGASVLTSSPGPEFEDPSFSPNGQVVAFTSADYVHGRFRIATVNADGTNLRVLTIGQEPSLSPDGSQIVYTRGSFSRRFGKDQIWVINSDGTNPHPISAKGVWSYPVFSPDGTKIAVERARNVVIMNADGSRLKNLTGQYKSKKPPFYGLFIDPEFSPDGQWIAISGSPDGTRYDIYLIHPDGTGFTRLVHTRPQGQLVSPAFSPDGTQIAFIQESGLIAVANADGTGQHVVATVPAHNGRGLTTGLSWQPVLP